ncbi:MAG: UDP-glucose dehydrogenase family protein [Hyphomonadaceae bacterium]|jgi:UDPglucose 6-dehydrogenase|uniref:UDP-glucose dehydrogenase family protein n=1 Tax=Aquidulcibacter sp. TaxID=2052990 RepID=UPI0022BD07DE|nr:UDP-glucose/GDP-mannose dehydrogenase family protein [Aquidulcibacter sp.]MCE2892540.1 UDP-glucose/GDP-mannose dehydrogenase family protein [Hyphomonadaceae bacterium]MCZ8210092.1 UDP-glucose/GDP-mannose dehydrogenase family protein [Aquidulcibacter sp.]
MRVTMVGTGYVGLVSGACFADFGHQVTCVDKDVGKIERLHQGIMPIFEPGLEDLVASNVNAGRLSFTTDLSDAVKDADTVFIAVGTPSRRGDGHADLSYVEQAAREIAEHMQGYTVVVNKSTVPVGTGDLVQGIMSEVNPKGDFSVVSNPEFLREGAAIGDFKRPDRVVVGTEDERARQVMRELYRPLFLNETPILFTDRRTSELIKYAANAFLAVKIAYINEMADLCEQVGANVQEVARGIGLDNRIGKKFLNAGPGYGGSCFPKDTLALMRTAQEANAPVTIVEATVASNTNRKKRMAGKIIEACGGDVAGKTVGILGLTFKPNTDDMRDSPSLDIVPALLAAGAKVRAYDPEGMEEAKKELSGIEMVGGPYEVADNADAIVILTEWDQFRALDFERIATQMRKPVMVDLRNIYNPDDLRQDGFTYVSIGRK